MRKLNFDSSTVSDMILYCKDTPVYNIDKEEVITHSLLPGLMSKSAYSGSFKRWFKLRYSSNTNTLARRLKGVYFGQGNRVKINETTHAFSLSDSYWIKRENDSLIFKDGSPYYSNFWQGKGPYLGEAIPTLYVGGFLNKEWISANELYKYGEETVGEYLAISLCEECGIPVVKAVKIEDGICLVNLTTPEVMLEQADESGRLDPDEFDNDTIVELFGLDGIRMIVIDAIIANSDRHAGNFGWLRNTTDGSYISMAPLYDFDHAFDSDLEWDPMCSEVISLFKNLSNLEYRHEIIRICAKASKTKLHTLFVKRSINILKELL